MVLRSIGEVNFWTSILENLNHPGLIIAEFVVFVLLCVAVIILYFHKKSSYHYNSITNEEFGRYTGLAVAIAFLVGIATLVIGGGGVHYSSAKMNALEENIYLKYDLEVVELSSVEYRSIGAFGSVRFVDTDSGIQRGFYDDETEEFIPSVRVVFDQSGEPTIAPWDGVDQKFVDSLVRPNWGQG